MVFSGNTNDPYLFTGKERDVESGLDNFGARYFGSSMGRFMSPDWSDSPDAVPYANLETPQSLNLYAYAGNNPISASDADGHMAEWGSASKEVCSDGSIADVCASAKMSDPIQINPATLMQYVKAASNAVSNALHTASNIVSTSQTLCKLSTTVGGIAGGALTGGEGGAALGAPIGAGFGTFALPGGGTLAGGAAGAGLGAAIGGVGGGIAGGAAGYGLGNAMCSSGSGSGSSGVGPSGPKVTFGHGARHLVGSGLNAAKVESAIAADAQASVRGASSTGGFWGKVVVDGKTITYRAMPLADGSINIGTYTLPRP